MTATVPVHGETHQRFASVREAFARNFEAHGEVGAGVAVYQHGEPVVELWGGWADAARTTPWQQDTIVNVYSTTKGLTAICGWAPEGRAAVAPGAGARSPHGFATLQGDRCCPGHGPSARLGRRSRRGGRWQTTETAACCAASTTRHAPAQWRTSSPSSGSVRCAARWRRKRPARRTSRVGPALAPIHRVPGVATRRRVVASGRAAGVRGFTLVSPEEIAETTVVKRRAERAS